VKPAGALGGFALARASRDGEHDPSDRQRVRNPDPEKTPRCLLEGHHGRAIPADEQPIWTPAGRSRHRVFLETGVGVAYAYHENDSGSRPRAAQGRLQDAKTEIGESRTETGRRNGLTRNEITGPCGWVGRIGTGKCDSAGLRSLSSPGHPKAIRNPCPTYRPCQPLRERRHTLASSLRIRRCNRSRWRRGRKLN
jgi:hypothetical protein